jgi:hypothetical protein
LNNLIYLMLITLLSFLKPSLSNIHYKIENHGPAFIGLK